jgi:hypothetical protein
MEEGIKKLGFHSEWNLGSPGGWDYQRLAQILARLAWERLNEVMGIPVDLDFDHPLLNPVPPFAEFLLRAHRSRHGSAAPSICLVAEEETLEVVGENKNMVRYLDALPGVSACLAGPAEVEREGDLFYCRGQALSLIFMDFNASTLLKLHKEGKAGALLEAVHNNVVVNPRGMEPINSKAVFEAVSGEYAPLMQPSTVDYTPWTRFFYPRKTTGPQDQEIPDLMEWTRENQESLVLKPAHGYSGQGVCVGPMRSDWEGDVQTALEDGDYIVQQMIPIDWWTEEFPWLEREKGWAGLHSWQTDFRCFITDDGLMGFVTRFGGVPTNVGAGGGVQGSAVLKSGAVREAVEVINRAILTIPYHTLEAIQQEVEEKAVEIGHIYLLGPIKTTLRPRIISRDHLAVLGRYARNLWRDAVILEKLYMEGKLKDLLKIDPEEEALAAVQPWGGQAALIASDGLFNFIST